VFDAATIHQQRLRRRSEWRPIMAQGNLSACLKVTLAHEGGWSDHKDDPGGATMKGITIGRYRQERPGATKSDLRNISDAEVERIYRVGYWNKGRCEDLPYGIDLATFDYNVNSGPARGVKALQAATGSKQDGVAGTETIAAARAADPRAVIKRMCSARLGFVMGLSTWTTFGRGWSRRIADVEAKAVAMWLASGGKLTPAARDALNDEGRAADSSATKQQAGGGAVAAGGGVSATSDVTWIGLAVLAAAVVIVGVVLFARAQRNRDRAAAYRNAASAL
jgi:lysozyme family protein